VVPDFRRQRPLKCRAPFLQVENSFSILLQCSEHIRDGHQKFSLSFFLFLAHGGLSFLPLGYSQSVDPRRSGLPTCPSGSQTPQNPCSENSIVFETPISGPFRTALVIVYNWRQFVVPQGLFILSSTMFLIRSSIGPR